MPPLEEMLDETLEEYLDDCYYEWFESEVKSNIYNKSEEFKHKIIQQFGERRALRKYSELFGCEPHINDRIHLLYAHILIDFSFRRCIWSYSDIETLFHNI